MATLAYRLDVRSGWRAAVEVMVAALLLVAAVAANRAPTVFTDSDDYYELGHQIVADVAERLHPAPPRVLNEEEADDAAQVAEDRHMGHSQMASRSAAYALLLYPLDAVGTLWLVTLVQSLIVAWVVRDLWRAAVPDVPPCHYLLGMGVLAAATPLPFFAGFAMPDVFAGVTVVAAVRLVVYRRTGSGVSRRAAGAVLAYAMAVHTSHLLLAVALLPVLALMLWRLVACAPHAWG